MRRLLLLCFSSFRSTRIGTDLPIRSVFQLGYEVQRLDHRMSGCLKTRKLCSPN